MSNTNSNPIIVALDLPTKELALQLVDQLTGVVNMYKIGSELFTTGGPDIVRVIRQTGALVFLDLKYHDIPNTVAKGVAAATRLDVQMITLHTSGGIAMMKAAKEAVTTTAQQLGIEPPALLGVTILTSFSSTDLGQIGMTTDVGKQVNRLANLAVEANLPGLVCSPLELIELRRIVPENMLLVTPGIRSPQEAPDDQKRTLSAKEALDAGASRLVIGRPITSAPNPRKAAEEILSTL